MVSSFKNLKKEKVISIRNGINFLMEKEIKRVMMLADDTAAWDTLYKYAKNPSKEIEKDMAPFLFIKYINLSLYTVIDKEEKIIFITGYNRIKKLKLSFESFINKSSILWKFYKESLDSDKTLNHMLLTEYGPMILTSSSIRKSDGTGPTRGKIIFGHIIDKKFADEISDALGEEVRFKSKEYSPKMCDLLFEWDNLKVFENDKNLEILMDVIDTHNNYTFTINVLVGKKTFNIFKRIILVYTLVLTLIFIIAGLYIYIFFNKKIIDQIESISEKTTKIVTSDDLSIKFPVTSNDEIGQLKKNLNNMLKRVKKEIKNTYEAQNMLMLNEKMVFLGNITASIAHEVINPLFAVSNAVEFVKNSDCTSDIKIRDALKIIESETSRVREIAMNLNRYSIPNSLIFSEADLNEIIESAITVVKWSKNINKISFRILRYYNKFPLFCNPGAIQQVFINLIVNAVDAMDGEGMIVINVFEEGENYIIDFIDDGPGFDESVTVDAFQSFISTKAGKNTGLGLYISYNIIKDHRGTISINTETTEGAHLIIKIPKKGVSKDDKPE